MTTEIKLNVAETWFNGFSYTECTSISWPDYNVVFIMKYTEK